MKRSIILPLLTLLGGALVTNAPPAAAVDVSLESRTYVLARGSDSEGTHIPFYEYLNLDAEDLGRPGLYLRAGAWGRADVADDTFGRATNGELQYAFVGWRAPRSNAEARVGRVSLTAGVARNEVFDGVLLGTDLPAGFDVTVFGGIPVETDAGGRSDDTLYGARVSQGRAGRYRIGASYLKEENAGSESREEAGADVFLAPLPFAEVTGSSLYNLIAEDWARHDYRIALGPFLGRARLTATWASTDYRIYFQSPVHPAFEPEADEKLDRIGGELEVELGRGFTLSGEYTAYQYDVSGDATAYGAGLAWAGSGIAAGGEYRQVHGDADENRYQEFSAHGTKSFGRVSAAAGAEYVAYETEINGEKNATTGKLALSYAVSRALELTASAEYGKTPEYEREVKGFLAVLWRYDASIKKGGTK